MAAINSTNNSNSSNNTTAGGSNMYRVGDYVYFEAQQQQQQQQNLNNQQQQPFQIRRIEELNKTAGGNVEAKVMCFYRRRDLPAQLVALADKHQQHQQQQQLNLPLSSGGNSPVKSNKQAATIKSDKDIVADKKDDIGSGGTPVKKEQRQTTNENQVGIKSEISEGAKIVKEEQQQQDAVMKEEMENNSTIKSRDGEGGDINNKSPVTGKDDDKLSQAAQQQQDWWRSEQLKQRELFLSRQVETLAATHIRGKCTVTLYNETESLDSYLEREDTFFYCLVFDPVQKTLLADKGEIRVGHKYQAEVPPKALYSHRDMKSKEIIPAIKGETLKEENKTGNGDEPMLTECNQDNDDKSGNIKSSTAVATVNAIECDSDLETLIWTCRPQWNCLTDRQIDQFLVVSRSLGTFARALDCTSSVKQPSLHMSAAAASRDITLFHAMDTLHRHGYDLGTATCSLVPSTGPVLCRDEMEEWSASEANLFEEALEKYGKDFGDIRHDFLPWKTHKNIVEYYYMWKTTDRYVQQKRVKAVEQESKLKQVYIPSYNGTATSGGKQQAITSSVMIKNSQQQQQMVNGNSAAIELYSSKNGSSGLSALDGPLLSGMCDLCDSVASQQWYPNTIGATTGATVSYHQQNGGLPSIMSSTLCHECWTHWKKYGGPRTSTSDKKVVGGRVEIVSGDEDRPHSNASSSSAAMNLNVSAGSGRSSSHASTASAPPHHHHHLMHLGSSGSSHHSNYHHQPQQHHQNQHHQQQSATASQGGSGLLLHQPHINSTGSSTTSHRCTIIGCQAAPFKSKSQLLRHYSTAHGIGINSNSTSSPTTIITSASGSRSSSSGGIDGGGSGTLSPQPQQQQTSSGAGLLHHNTGGPLNLNSNSMQHANAIGGINNQVINLMASSSPQQLANNLSAIGGGLGTTTIIGTGGITTATGRPVMKTRTAFYLRCTSLAKASRRRAAQQAAAALLQQQHHQKKSSGTPSAPVLSPISASIQPGCLARPRNVARRPFICVPQTAHTYKHECMLSMQHAPVHELRAYLRAAAVKAHARRPGVTRVANALIAARRGRNASSATIAADLAVPDWLSLPSQQHQHQSSHHHVSSSSKHGKHSSRSSTGGRVAFPKPPKAPDGSLLYERVPNKQEAAAAATLNNPSAAAAAAAAAAVGLNPATAAAILGALGPPGSIGGGSAGAPGTSNDPSAAGFDVAAAAAALYQQQQQQQQSSSSSGNKRRLYETDGAAVPQQPQPQVGPPSKRMHRQQHHPQQQHSATGHHHNSQQHQQQASSSALSSQVGGGGGAVDGMLASLVAHQQQQQQQRGSSASGGPMQLSGNKSGPTGPHQQAQQQQNHYRTPSMARTGRKHVISWTDAPDDLYYRCTSLSRSLRKARMTGRELRRSARKPWKQIAALLGISFSMPPAATASSAVLTAGIGQQSNVPSTPSSAGASAPFDMSTTGSGSRQPPAAIIQPPHASGSPAMSSRIGGSHH